MTHTVELPQTIVDEIIRSATAAAADRMLSEALLTIQESADMLKVSLSTLNRLPIQRVKLGGATRYRRQDITDFINFSLEK